MDLDRLQAKMSTAQQMLKLGNGNVSGIQVTAKRIQDDDRLSFSCVVAALPRCGVQLPMEPHA